MSDLTAFRDHCKRMADESHKLDCKATVVTRWQSRTFWPDPKCPGCNSEADRALFAALAAEVDDYLDRPVDVDLFGELTAMPAGEEPR